MQNVQLPLLCSTYNVPAGHGYGARTNRLRSLAMANLNHILHILGTRSVPGSMVRLRGLARSTPPENPMVHEIGV